MAYPLNTPLGRFGIEQIEETTERCVASIPTTGLLNPVTGAPTIAPLAMLVDHIGGVINHGRRGAREWTVSSELALEMAPNAAETLRSSAGGVVVGQSQALGVKNHGALGYCELTVDDIIVATATVRSFYITAPEFIAEWPVEPGGSLPGSRLDQLMAVTHGESAGGSTILHQSDDPVLNNSVGTVHGGVSSMGLEVAGSAVINSGADGAVYETASLRVNFLRPFHGGDGAHYSASTLHRGRSSAVAEATAVGSDGRVALLARVTAYR